MAFGFRITVNRIKEDGEEIPTDVAVELTVEGGDVEIAGQRARDLVEDMLTDDYTCGESVPVG